MPIRRLVRCVTQYAGGKPGADSAKSVGAWFGGRCQAGRRRRQGVANPRRQRLSSVLRLGYTALAIVLCGGSKATQRKDIAQAKEYWRQYHGK